MSKIKDTFKFIVDKLMRSIERFPMTLLVTLAFVTVVILQIHADFDSQSSETLERLIMTLSLAIPLTAAAKLGCEKMKVTGLKSTLIQAGTLIIPLIYYLMMPEELTEYFVMRFMALWAILFFVFLLVPYFYKREGLAQYILHLAGKWFLTVLFSGVLFGGLSMMVFTLEALFNIDWWDEVYIDLFFVIAGTFGMTHFLGCIPEIDHQLEKDQYSKIFKTLFLYIVLPIVSVYTLILYAYFVKILIGFKLPEGIIGNLVLWYALVSVSTLFFVRDLKDEVSWLSKFMKLFIPLMSVPLGMLFLAIFIRIDAYGITMPRYFVAALGVFTVVNLCIMWFKKGDTAVVNIVVLMSLIGITFFGTFSGYQLTLRDQSQRLEDLLVAENMLDDAGKIIAKADLSKESKSKIADKINFLLRTYDPSEIDVLPDDFNRANAEKTLGFNIDYYDFNDNYNTRYFSYYHKDPNKIIALDEADFMMTLNRHQTIKEVALGDGITLSKTESSPQVDISKDGKVILAIDLEKAAAEYYLDQTQNVTKTSDDDSVQVMIYFNNLDGIILNQGDPQNIDELEVQYFDAILFIKLK